MKSKNKIILWDNDGVLVETESLYFQASKEILKKVRYELTEEVFFEVSLKKGESLMDLALQAGVPSNQLSPLRTERDDRYAELLKEKVVIREGVMECLKALQSLTRMMIVTSSQKTHFELIHSNSGILPYMEGVITREDFLKPKPHPDSYLTALKKWDLKADDCIVIEDSERGVKSAKAAGLFCLAVPHELSRWGDYSEADQVLPSVGAAQEKIISLL